MSRSKGAGGLADLIANQGGERIRFFLLRTHYRSTVLFNEPAIEEAGIGLETFYRLFKRYERISGNDFYAIETAVLRDSHTIDVAGDPILQEAIDCRDQFLNSMDDDFNTGGAIAELFELAKITNKYCDADDLEGAGKNDSTNVERLTKLLTTFRELSLTLGLFVTKPAADPSGTDELLDQILQLVIDLRTSARQGKRFETADQIRDGVAAAGLVLEDRPGGTEWSGGNSDATEAMMQLVIQVRANARSNKDFETADIVRKRLTEIGVELEDRAGGTEWTKG